MPDPSSKLDVRTSVLPLVGVIAVVLLVGFRMTVRHWRDDLNAKIDTQPNAAMTESIDENQDRQEFLELLINDTPAFHLRRISYIETQLIRLDRAHEVMVVECYGDVEPAQRQLADRYWDDFFIEYQESKENIQNALKEMNPSVALHFRISYIETQLIRLDRAHEVMVAECYDLAKPAHLNSFIEYHQSKEYMENMLELMDLLARLPKV